MAIAVANCSQTPLASLDKGGHPPKQSMWQRLGWRKLLGRDDRDTSAGESQDETSPRPSSDQSRAKHDNLTRRISRKVGVGLPRNLKRQSSDLDRLAPREPDHRRALSADRRPMSAQRTRSPPPTDPRKSAPEIQWLGPPTTTVDDIEPDETNDAAIDDMSGDWDPYPDPDPELETELDTELDMELSKAPESEMEDVIDLDMELEQRWILNLSMHFRDRSEREKFFVTYAETPNRWRRVTVSCDYRDAPPDSLEGELKGLRYQRDKCARIYESIRESLLGIRFYDGVTNLKLETSDGQLHVFVTEDVNETIPYPPITSIGHLVGAPMIPEHMLHFESHLSGFVYKVNFGGRFYIKKEIPGPDTVDEFLYEINALHALTGIPSVIQVEGIVIDEERCVVKGLLISYAEQGALVDILYEQHGRTDFARRERWAKQIVQGLCEIHESGYVQGDFTLANIVVDANDNAKIIDINRRGCPVGWEPPEIAAKIESNQRISMYIGVKTDLFQLGMTLWALAMEDDEPERQPRPLFLGEDAKVPDYYRRIVQICLSPNPRHRLSAKDLLVMFPPEVRSVYVPAARPLDAVPSDPRRFPSRNDWSQPPPAEFGMDDPRGMMRHTDQYYPQKDFSDNAYPHFDKHDLGKRSTITLAEPNGDMAFPSNPSSSSTLNHHDSPRNDEYLDYSRYSDESSRYLPTESQGTQATSISHQTPRSNTLHDHPMELRAVSTQVPHTEAHTKSQNTNTQDEWTGSTYQHPRGLPGTANTVSPANIPPTTPSKPQDHDRRAPKSTKQEDLLTSSCLAINPALSSGPHDPQSDPSTTIPPSTPTTQNDPKKTRTARTNTANTKPTPTRPSPSNSLIGSGSPISPKTGNTGASLGLGTKFPAASPFTNMLRQSGGQPALKPADANLTGTPLKPSSATASSVPLSSFPTSVNGPKKVSPVDSTPTTSVELSPIERSINEASAQPQAKFTEAKPTLETQCDSSLHGSSLPISPTAVDSVPLNPISRPVSRPGVESSGLKPAGNKPALTSHSNSTISLLCSNLPISPASANSIPILNTGNEHHVKRAIQPTLLRSPDSTSSLIDSRLPISPATINSKSIAEAMDESYTLTTNAKPALPWHSDSSLPLLGSRMPISPASADSLASAKTLAQPTKPVNINPLISKSESSLLTSSLPINPAGFKTKSPAKEVKRPTFVQHLGPSDLFESRLPISPASMDSEPPMKAMNQQASKVTSLSPASAELPSSYSLLGSDLPINPALANGNTLAKGKPHTTSTEAKSALAQPSEQSNLLSSSLPISPAFADRVLNTQRSY